MTCSYLASLVMIVLSFQNSIGDFGIFYNAAENLSLGLTPFVFQDQKDMYLNGPLLSILLIPISYVSESVALTLWRISNVLITFILVYLLKNERNRSLWICFLPLMILTFPWRNNFANTSLVVFQLLLLVLSAKFILKNRPAIGTIFLFVSFELKPYLSITFLLILLFCRKFQVLKFLCLYTIIANIVYFWLFNFSYLDWIRALLARSGSWTDADQSTLRTMLWKYLNVSENGSTLLGIIFYLAVLFWFFANLPNNLSEDKHDYLNSHLLVSSLVTAPLFPFYSHEQDFLLSFFAIGIVLRRTKSIQVEFPLLLSAVFMLNWSNIDLRAAFVFSLLTSYLLLYGYRLSIRKYYFPLLVCINILSYLAVQILVEHGTTEQFYFHNLIALIFGISVVFLYKKSVSALKDL